MTSGNGNATEVNNVSNRQMSRLDSLSSVSRKGSGDGQQADVGCVAFMLVVSGQVERARSDTLMATDASVAGHHACLGIHQIWSLGLGKTEQNVDIS